MCTRFIEFMVKQLPGAGAMMLPVLFPLLAHTQQEKSRVIFFEPETLDTLFVSELEENQELISFEPKKLKHKYDVVILQKSNSQGSFALHVPAQEGKPNIYRLVKGNSYFPFYLTGEPQKFLVFEGNTYLEAYNKLVSVNPEMDNMREDEREKYARELISKMIGFEQKFRNAQIIGYHYLYLQNELKNYFPEELARIAVRNKGYYYAILKERVERVENKTCIDDQPDSLIFQSEKSHMDLEIADSSIHVLIFWATWCGPCKPLAQQLNELNKNYYADSPVYFDAITSEDDLMKAYRYYEDHPEFFSSLGFFNDSEQCMQTNYNITKLPTVLVFDRNKKLV